MNLIEPLRDHWRAGVEILVLWILIYQVYRVFRATKGVPILVGLAAVVILLTLASQILELKVIEWIIKSAAAILAFALLIIFQPELRNGLARLGSANLFSFSRTPQKVFLETLAESVVKLSKKRFGALFAIERGIDLEDYESTGVTIDSVLSVELVATIFHPQTALHDGGLILKKRAGCFGFLYFSGQSKKNFRIARWDCDIGLDLELARRPMPLPLLSARRRERFRLWSKARFFEIFPKTNSAKN